MPTARRPRLTACRSASPPWPWPRSCNAGRRGRAYPDELARLEDDPGLTGPGGDIGRELFRLVVKAREAGRDPEMELRAAARRYRDLVRAWERS